MHVKRRGMGILPMIFPDVRNRTTGKMPVPHPDRRNHVEQGMRRLLSLRRRGSVLRMNTKTRIKRCMGTRSGIRCLLAAGVATFLVAMVALAAPEFVGVRATDDLGFDNLALNPNARPTASSALPGHAIHQIDHLNDGMVGNTHSWISNGEPSWAEIDLGKVYWVYEIAFASDARGAYQDRAAASFSILTATEYNEDNAAPTWNRVYGQSDGPPVHMRREFTFMPVQARWVRIAIDATTASQVRIDEIEIFGQARRISANKIKARKAKPGNPVMARDAEPVNDDLLRRAFLGEEHAWLKTYGRADLSPRLIPYNGRITEYPKHVGDDHIPLPALSSAPNIDGKFKDACWDGASRGVARVAFPYDWRYDPVVNHEVTAGWHGEYLYLSIRADRLLSAQTSTVSTATRYGHGVAVVSAGNDQTNYGIITITRDGLSFSVHDPEHQGAIPADRIPLDGAYNRDLTEFEVRVPLELIPNCRAAGLRIGLGMGGKHTDKLGRPIHLAFSPLAVAQAGPCLNGVFEVRFANTDDAKPLTVRGNAPGLDNGLTLAPGQSKTLTIQADRGAIGPEYSLEVQDNLGGAYEFHLFRYDPLERTLTLMAEHLERLASKGLEVETERKELAEFRQDQQKLMANPPRKREAARKTVYKVRTAKRDLFFREPDLAPIERVLFVKRHAFRPSHNYSANFDSAFRPGGGICVVRFPHHDGRFHPEDAEVTQLFDAEKGIARTPMADFDLRKVYFAYRPAEGDRRWGTPLYYHLMATNPDGTGLEQLTDGPFHDYWPCPLPNGDMAVISTRCKMRYICWRPQAFTLFRMSPDGTGFRPLSHANLSEWAPSVMNDGRLIWTRSEYQDKGADFGHTLWAIRPDGRKPELVFGNDIIQPNGYANGREVPGTNEVSCTLISHFGDLNGPIALVDIDQGRFNKEAITSLTPEVPWPGNWPIEECFRDAVPISRDFFLCSHAPQSRFGLFVIDRFGNRELLYADADISSMCPTPFRPQPKPPVLADEEPFDEDTGEFVVRDVYKGISPPVERGRVKYIRVVQEVPAVLDQLPNGEYRQDHPLFPDWYATPIHKVYGPYGWPTYVAKAPYGIVPVEEDGSARFKAPAGKTLYFQVLDKDFNELQRMRSVVQLQPGEKRSCIGCHEHRQLAPANTKLLMATEPRELETPDWAGVPFSFEKVVQPVLDAKCVQCHGENHKMGINLTGALDVDKVPASYRTLISKGFVHFADMQYNAGGTEKIEPLELGTLKSKLWQVLDAGHHDVELTTDEMRRVKTWIDLNCPLWPDYINRVDRPGPAGQIARAE